MKTVARKLRLAMMPALALALSACWETDKPLILPGLDSAEPLASGTYDYNTDGETLKVMLIRFPGGGYVYAQHPGENDNPDDVIALPVLAHQVSDDWFVLQAGGEDGGVLYGLARMKRSKLTVYDPLCDERVDSLAGVATDKGDCSFADLASLTAAARAMAESIDSGGEADLLGTLDLDSREDF